MRKPKVKASFVIPVYNGELHIATAIDSCLRQSEKNVEVIVVNDGSTDSTGDVLTWIAQHNPQVKVTTFAENQGRSAARNAGITNASADILLMLDADDIAHPERVKLTLKHFKQNPTVDIVYGRYQLIDTIGNLGPLIPESGLQFDWKRVLETKLFYIGHSTMAMRREVFEKIAYTSGEFSSLGIDDWKLQADAHKAGFTFGVIPSLLAFYRYKEKKRDEVRIAELKEAELRPVVAPELLHGYGDVKA